MAQYLIYNKDHWSASVRLTPEQVEKFKGCYKKGDIIEVRPDGYWGEGRGERGFDKESFTVVSDKLSYESAKQYMEPLTKEVATTEVDDEGAVITRTDIIASRKYQITNTIVDAERVNEVDAITLTTKSELSIVNETRIS